MSEEQQAALGEVIDLLDQVGARLGALGIGAPDVDGPTAAETGAMHRARACLSRERAEEMRAGLDDVRRRAAAVAVQMRERRGDVDVLPTPWWDDVAAAADRLLAARLDDGADVRGHLLDAARIALPAAAGVGLVWCDDDGAPAAFHRDDDVLDALAEHTRRPGGGPGTAALVEGEVRVPDLRIDRRWPDLAARAESLGVGSLLAVRLTADGQERGRDRGPHLVALFHAPRPRAFGVTARAAARLFARQAAILLAGSRRAAGLLQALEGRDVIGQAKGVLMARDGVSSEEAFARLSEASQSTNVKLRDVAAWLVEQTRRG
ncbi:ANTAR domain-containing protein [Actinomycetospora soli]|uniref:ANTAR domain-containing protein n=1 Tax=Actinomycetospora soli TaxID=2893887 RepID=UPI001E4E26FE|nr:ANTAR domain-containing protein [Actinomycetospora soli]